MTYYLLLDGDTEKEAYFSSNIIGEESFGVYPPDRTAKGAPSVSAPTLKLLLEYVNEELAKR